MWFFELTGIENETIENVYSNVKVQDGQLICLLNGRQYQIGDLVIASLNDLRKKAENSGSKKGKMSVSQIIADVTELHEDPANENALFQVASQFNLLEMQHPDISPEMGLSRYAFDKTQGPACAMTCGAGTVYRNYFAPFGELIGQTKTRQLDCLGAVANFLNNDEKGFWLMKNGYPLFGENGILRLNAQLSIMTEDELEKLAGLLKIGIQWQTEVTTTNEQLKVSQVFCSAIPVAYNHLDSIYYRTFASLILEASYEATILAGIMNYEKTGCNKVYLTLIGGGAFGNEMWWIYVALEKVITKYARVSLDIKIVSYQYRNNELDQLIARLNEK